VEKAPKARIGDLDKKKYLVPSDLTGWVIITVKVLTFKLPGALQSTLYLMHSTI